ncbi:hypothetical protein BDZ89DRAFT_778482 [Hymenopellis radicata]|nr:hypothetical protein BDZ89DRAFT_778482 [Hymenopellis radicata]
MMEQDTTTPFPSPAPNPVTRITDVVPANFLCDTQALAKVAESKLLDEKALLALDEELSALEARLQGLKDQMAAVEQLIADAVATQTRLRSSIATHTTLLSSSPLRALPGEVLSEIFLHYVALFPPSTRDVFKAIVACHRIQSPLLQVCRRWRTTALADPRL